MSTTYRADEDRRAPSHPPTAFVAFAWALVGVPLAYGLYNTVLAAGALCAHGVDLEVRIVDDDVDVFRFRQHRNRRRRGVDAALRFGGRYALHAVHARLKFQFAVHVFAGNAADNFFVAARGTFLRID